MGVADKVRVALPCFVALTWMATIHGAGHLYNPVNTLTTNTGTSMMFEKPEGEQNMKLLKSMAGGSEQQKKILFLMIGMLMRSEANWVLTGSLQGAAAALFIPLEYRFPAYGLQTFVFLCSMGIHAQNMNRDFPPGVEMFDGPHVDEWAKDYVVINAVFALLCGGLFIDSLMASRKAKQA